MKCFKIIAIIALCALCGIMVAFAGYKGTGKEQKSASVYAGRETPLRQQAIPAAPVIPLRSYVKDINVDLNYMLETTKEFARHGDFVEAFSQVGAVLALNDNPDPKKNTLAKFMNNVLNGLYSNTDIDTAKGLIMALASMDRTALQGKNNVSEGLLQLMERNMYGQVRTAAQVKTSTLRSLLLMLDGAGDIRNLKIFGLDTHIPMLYFLDSPDHPAGAPGTVAGITKNVAGWAMGEIATARQWGREGKIKQGGAFVPMNEFQALDWVLYKKRYRVKILGIPLMTFDGLAGIVSSRLVRTFSFIIIPRKVSDAFPAFVEVAGGMSDAEYHGGRCDGFTTTSWMDRYGTAGRRHKVYALLAPVIEYYWNAQKTEGRDRTKEMVALAASLNEIDPSAYKPLTILGFKNPKATFRQDAISGHKTVIQTLEDSGVLNILLKHNSENDLLAPQLDLLISIINAMNARGSAPAEYKKAHPEFRGDTLFDIVFTELNLLGLKKHPKEAKELIDATMKALFEPKKGESKNTVAKLSDLVDALAKQTGDKAYMAVVRADLVKIIQATQDLINSPDLERIVPALDTILVLNDDPDYRRNTLARYLNRVLHAFAPVSDGETIKGLLLALNSIDRSAIESHGIIEGLIYMAHYNMYAQPCNRADINVSQMRSFLFLVENADRHIFLTVNNQETGIDLASLLDSPDHPPREPGTVSSQTTQLLEWYMGEMATAARWGREGKIMLNGRPVYMNPIQAYDWMFYKKRYSIAGLGRKPVYFDGISGVITNLIAQSFLAPGGKDTLATLAEIAGGMTDAEYAHGRYTGFTSSSWQDRYGTAGRRHKFLALAYPMLEYIWSRRDEQGGQRLRDFRALIRSLNEMSPVGYQPLFTDGIPNRNATLRHDERFAGKSVIKAVEDGNLLRIFARSHGPNDSGVLAPGLDLLITIVGKLNEPGSAPADYKKTHPRFGGNTMLDYLFEEMQIKGLKRAPGEIETTPDPIDKAIQALFVPLPGETQNVITKLHGRMKVCEQVIEAIRAPKTDPSPSAQAEAALRPSSRG